MPECGQFAQYGWAGGFCKRHAIMRGCSKAANKSAACGAMEKREADAEVAEPWFDKDPELPDREAYEEDYEEVLRCLGNTSDDVGAATELRTGHSLKSSQQIRNLHCWLVGEEWSIQDDDKGLDDQVGFFPHQWEKGRQLPLKGWLPRDEDGFHTLPIGALAHAVLWGCESNLAATTKELKAVSDDWLQGMELGSVKKAWWQTMRLRRLRQKTTVPKYDVWSEIRKLGLEEMKYDVWSGIRNLGLEEMPDTSSIPRTRWEKAGQS